jgi:hypothetical protein
VATTNIRHKRPRTPALTGLASTVSASLASTGLEDPQPVPLLAAPGREREIRGINLVQIHVYVPHTVD